METYYVDSASSGGDGSNERPFSALVEASDRVKPGDTVYVTGTFRETLDLRTPNVTWRGNLATLDGGYTKRGAPPTAGKPGSEYGKMIEIDAAGVVVDGFTIQNVAGQPVGFTKQANGAKLLNCTLDGAYGGGIVADDCSNILIENVKMHHCNLKRFDEGNTGGGAAHVQVNLLFKGVTGSVIRGCEVSENWGEGIGLSRNSRNCTIENCAVHTNLHMHIVLNSAQDCTVRNNFIYHSGNPEFFQRKSGEPPSGITIADEKQGAAKHGLSPSSGNKIYGNVVVGLGGNFLGRESKNSGGALIDTDVYNNTFVNAVGDDGANVLIRPAPHRGSRFFNNIIVQDSGNIAKLPGGSGVAFEGNVWSRKPDGAGASDEIGEVFLANHKARLDTAARTANYALTERSTLAIGKGKGGGDIGALPVGGIIVEPPDEEPPPVEEPPVEEPPTGEGWRTHYDAAQGFIVMATAELEKMAAVLEAKE